MKHELVSEFDDLFELTHDELLQLPGFKDVSARNLLAAIAARRTVSLARFLVGLSILHVGEETAYLLARTFGTLDALRGSTREALIAIPGVGEVVADALISYFGNEENRDMLARLEKHITLERVESVQGGVLDGLSVVITGTLPTLSRDEAEEMVRSAGGTPASSVSKSTAFVVAGESAGSKLTKANELGILVLSEGEFRTRLGL